MGHQSRLNRPTLVDHVGFGSETYARKELRAEIAAMMSGELPVDGKASALRDERHERLDQLVVIDYKFLTLLDAGDLSATGDPVEGEGLLGGIAAEDVEDTGATAGRLRYSLFQGVKCRTTVGSQSSGCRTSTEQ